MCYTMRKPAQNDELHQNNDNPKFGGGLKTLDVQF